MVKQLIVKILTICLPWIFGIFGFFNYLVQIFKHGIKILDVKARPIPPPILNDPKYGMHKYMTLKGREIKIHYVEKGDSKNPLLLCLHGFPELWFSWRHQLEHLSSKFWVVAIDLRGFGDSNKPSKLSDYSHGSIVEDIHQFVLGLDRTDCTLLAHDFGAIFAWTMVTKYPELFQRHISINGPHLGILNNLLQNNWEQFKASWYIFFFNAPWIPEKSLALDDFAFFKQVFQPEKLPTIYPEEVIESYKYYYSKPGAMTPPLNLYRTAMHTPKEDIRTEKVTVPTLIIWGKEDSALIPENAKRCAKLCEDVQLKFIDGANHFVHEDNWQEVNELILEYCNLFN